ncbi:MAG: transposase [Chloroflexia bacterium]
MFRPCFSRRQWKYFVTVLLGLIEQEGRHTLKGLLASVWEKVSLSGLSRFLGLRSWSPAEVARTWQVDFRQEMAVAVQAEHRRQRAERPKRRGRPKATVVTGYLVLDDSVQSKPKGRKMAGLGQHYSATEKKVVSGHCLFTSLYVLLGRRCPLEPRLYRQKAVCEREGVPFRFLAVAEIEAFEPVPNTHTHVLVDSWYHCRRVRRAAQKRGWDISGGLKSNRLMRIRALAGDRKWVRLSDYAASLGADDWAEATWPSQEGGRKVYVHAMRTWVRKLGPTLVLITRESLSQPLAQARYWGSTLVDADAQTVINILAVRWDIETLFEDYKDLLGSDHLSATAIVRFWTLVSCLAYFLDKQRASLQAERPGEHVTWGDARRAIQAEHQRNLLVWLEDQFRSGVTAGQLCACLAA